MSSNEINFNNISMQELLKAYSENKTSYASNEDEESDVSIFECNGEEYNISDVESWLLDYGNGLTSEYLENAEIEYDDENETFSIKYDTDGIEGNDYSQIFSFNDDGNISEVLANRIDEDGKETEGSKSTFSYNDLTGETVKLYTDGEKTIARILNNRTEEIFDNRIEDMLKYTDLDSSLLNEDNITNNEDGSYTVSDGESSYDISITKDDDGNVIVRTTNNNTKESKNSKFVLNDDGTIQSKSFDGNDDDNYEVSKEYVYNENNKLTSYEYSFNPDTVKEEKEEQKATQTYTNSAASSNYNNSGYKNYYNYNNSNNQNAGAGTGAGAGAGVESGDGKKDANTAAIELFNIVNPSYQIRKDGSGNNTLYYKKDTGIGTVAGAKSGDGKKDANTAAIELFNIVNPSYQIRKDGSGNNTLYYKKGTGNN